MAVLTIPEACEITGLSRKQLVSFMESGEWDIGEIVQKPGARYKSYIIWSHKLAHVMGVSDAAITKRLAQMDERKRLCK